MNIMAYLREHAKTSSCKRYGVAALVVTRWQGDEGFASIALNRSLTVCTGEVGKCSCEHAEMIALAEALTPSAKRASCEGISVWVTTSPCLSCATTLSHTAIAFGCLLSVRCGALYRDVAGFELLKAAGSIKNVEMLLG